MKAPTLIAALVLSGLVAGTAAAQATRTWVSGVGDDVNPCSRTAPCKTFAGAISKTAAGGEIDVLDPGGFGGVTITKSISIEADGVIAGVLVTGTNAIVVQAGATDTVVLRGLTIEGVGPAAGVNAGVNGIRWLSGANLVIEKCTIHGFSQAGIDAQPTSGTPGAVSNLFVSDTQIRDNGFGGTTNNNGGILVAPGGSMTLKATISRVHFNNNRYGVRAQDNAYANIKDSVVSQSTTDGVVAQGGSNNAVAYIDNSFANNNTGSGLHAVGSNAYIFTSNTLVTGNGHGLNAETGGNIFSFGNNRVGGNFLSDGLPTMNLPQE